MADLENLLSRLNSAALTGQTSPHEQQAYNPSIPNVSRKDSDGYQPPSISTPLFSPPLSGPHPHHSSGIMSPNVKSTAATPGPDQRTSDRTASLLNLLKFTQPSLASPEISDQGGASNNARAASQSLASKMPFETVPNGGGRALSVSDAAASLTPRAPSTTTLPGRSFPSPGLQTGSGALADNPQEYLLKLLNQSKPASGDAALGRGKTEVSQPFESLAPGQRADDSADDIGYASLEPKSTQEAQRPNIQLEGRTYIPTEHRTTESPLPRRAQQAANPVPIFNYVNPFEQLAASSPRNRTPRPEGRVETPKSDAIVAKKDVTATDASDDMPQDELPPLSAPKLRIPRISADLGSDLSSPAPSPLPDGRTRVDALIGIGAQGQGPGSVSQAISDVGEQVHKEVEAALAVIDVEDNTKATEGSHRSRATSQVTAKEVHEAAVELQEALKNPEIRKAVEQDMPKVMADAFEDVIEVVARDQAQDDWESDDGAESNNEEDDDVRVFNFPLKPFAAISIRKLIDPPPTMRPDVIMEIARCKKPFDQDDRTLATASNTYIAYAMAKDGGFRVIRQDSGKDKQIFRSARDRIINLAICKAPIGSFSDSVETILATGLSGSIYWTPMPKSGTGFEQEEDFENKSVIFPPLSPQDENNSGFQLKTRVKKSSRHPEFFAIGWGKSINVVYPYEARSPAYLDGKIRQINCAKYLKERSLKITINKAAKDFCFSEDDTVIASIDKAGKLKLWDIHHVIDQPNTPIEVKQSLMTFPCILPTEKSSLTSVTFVDKERPVSKGVALRYVIVGSKQNHTLQLWDLGLGKPVQELHLPHESETDGICSIAYHARSGIIAIGHPTRNSIYFVHLSAPKYTLPNMTQAKYVQRLASKDAALPKTESTAIMSGVREFSFGNKSRLLSLDMLSTPNTPPEAEDAGGQDAVIFELYVMHTKGVTCLNIKRGDLGWGSDNRVLHPIDAEMSGAIVITEISPVPEPVVGESFQNGSASAEPAPTLAKSIAPASAKHANKQTPKKDLPIMPPLALPPKRESNAERSPKKKSAAVDFAAANGTNKNEKEVNPKEGAASAADRPSEAVLAPSKPLQTPLSYASAAQRSKSPLKPAQASPMLVKETKTHAVEPSKTSEAVESKPGITGDTSATSNLFASLQKVVSGELQTLYRRFDEDKRIQEAANIARQEAVLRLVSSTLTENVEKSLSRVVGATIEQSVLPSISNATVAAIDRKLQEVLTAQLHSAIPRELKAALPAAIGRAMQDPEVLRIISDLVANKVAAHVEMEFANVLHSTITPAFKNLALNAATKMSAEIEARVAEQVRHLDEQRSHDSHKIDQLTDLVQRLTDTMDTMAVAQAEMQRQFSELPRYSAEVAEVKQEEPESVEVPMVKSPEEEELEMITQLLKEGRYEEGTVKWLQSPNQTFLWDNLFVRVNPAYLQQLSPLVSLSVAAAVSTTFDARVSERLSWLENIFSALNLDEPEILEVAPRIMDLISRRLQAAYMTIAENKPANPDLRRISTLARQAAGLLR